jgi:hypothetical protein
MQDPRIKHNDAAEPLEGPFSTATGATSSVGSAAGGFICWGEERGADGDVNRQTGASGLSAPFEAAVPRASTELITQAGEEKRAHAYIAHVAEALAPAAVSWRRCCYTARTKERKSSSPTEGR